MYAVAQMYFVQRYFIFFLCFVFALAVRKNETQINWYILIISAYTGSAIVISRCDISTTDPSTMTLVP